jgi:hypothetical protein
MMARARSILLVFVVVLVAACTRDSAKKQLAIDLRDYVQEMEKWEPQEKQVFTALDEVERSQYVDDDFVIRALKGALPDVDEHLKALATYAPKTDDLRDVHAQYRQGWEALREAFTAVIKAMEVKDYVRLATAKNQMETARAGLLRTFQVLDGLLQENDEELKSLQSS